MKMEKINDNKIKFIISVDDLEERNIDIDSLNYNSPAAQELFWDMMEQAEIQFGFDTTEAQLCIEATPSPDEGFIITITRIEADGDFEAFQKYVKARLKRAELKSKKRGRRVSTTLLIYSFSTFDDLCELSRKTYNIFTGESTLYKFKDTYYLTITKNAISSYLMKSLDIVLCEFGNKIYNTNLYEGYLMEYGKKIIERNALQTLYKYF